MQGLSTLEEQKATIIKLYTQSFNVPKISSDLGLNDSTVRSALKKWGVYRSAKRWSKADDQYLIEHYATDSWEDLQSHFYWLEKASIIAHASQLKIKRGVYFWSDDDISLLRREYANGTSVRKIAELLCGKFTESAIATKVYKLGITRRHFWTDDELDLLQEHYYRRRLYRCSSFVWSQPDCRGDSR